LDVAIANKLTHVDAYIPMRRNEAGSIEEMNLDKSDFMHGGVGDFKKPEDFDQEQLGIGTVRELEHTKDEELAREIAMDHLTEDPDYYKAEVEEASEANKKPEPMVKMALIHDDPQNPVTVYRVQNENGEGPYNSDPKIYSKVMSLTSRNYTPPPWDDFPPSESGQLHFDKGKQKLRFAFEKPEHAYNWFGPKALDTLKEHGFAITPIKAKKVYRSDSGAQLMFEPHESETKLNMAKSDWPMSEAKEELDPSKPVNENSKVLDKGAMPEHIKSIRAHGRLVPGQIVDSRRIVGVSPSGKKVVREVSAGMQRSLDDTVSNTTGPGQGQPTSARNKPSRSNG
jgi:hypothetical protein